MTPSKTIFIIFILAVFATNCQESKHEQREDMPKGIIVAEYVKYFFPKLCYQKYFANGNFNAPRQCYLTVILLLKEISSRLLSLINTLIVFFIRIPQISKIVKRKSVFGLSYFGNNLQVNLQLLKFVMPAMTLGYGIYSQLPTSIYIENVLITVQSFIVLCLFFVYKQPNYEEDNTKMKLMFLTSMIVSIAFVFQLVPNYMQDVSIWLQLVVFFFGRGSQLLANYRNKSTGTLSILTVIITVTANSIRIFSILIEAPGHLAYLLNYLIPLFVNGYIMFQFYLYRDSQQQIEEKQKNL